MRNDEILRACLNRLGFHERTCVQCGEEFEAKDEYVYKLLSGRPQGHAAYHWFCSWHCIQAWRSEHGERERKPRKRQTKRAAEIEPLVLKMLSEGVRGVEIARRLDISQGWVSKIKIKERKKRTNGNDGRAGMEDDEDAERWDPCEGDEHLKACRQAADKQAGVL